MCDAFSNVLNGKCTTSTPLSVRTTSRFTFSCIHFLYFFSWRFNLGTVLRIKKSERIQETSDRPFADLFLFLFCTRYEHQVFDPKLHMKIYCTGIFSWKSLLSVDVVVYRRTVDDIVYTLIPPFAYGNLASPGGFGRPFQRQSAHLHTQVGFGAYLRDSSRFPRRRPFIYLTAIHHRVSPEVIGSRTRVPMAFTA